MDKNTKMQTKPTKDLNYDNLVQEAERVYRHSLQEALNLLKQATEIKPKNPRAWLVKGKILEYFRRYDEALTHFNHVIKIAPDCAEPWWQKAVMLRKLGQSEDAVKCAEKATDSDENDPDAWYYYGFMLDDIEEKVDDALDAYIRAYEMDAEHMKALFRIGKIELLEKHEPKYALTYLEKAERLAIEQGDKDMFMECRFHMGLAKAMEE